MALSLSSNRIKYYKSNYGASAIVFAILGFISITIALFSPFWLTSRTGTKSHFVRLGLWNVCFRNYQHPSLLFDGIFDGCYSLYSHKSVGIRNWLQPGWFILVQSLTASAAILSFLCICFLIYICTNNGKEKHIFLSAVIFVLESLAALMAFLAACVFGAMCFERSWIQYPKYNNLSWGYMVLLASVLLLSCAACCLLVQTFKMRKFLYRDGHDTIMYHVPFSAVR